jgi:hypothetical protein
MGGKLLVLLMKTSMTLILVGGSGTILFLALVFIQETDLVSILTRILVVCFLGFMFLGALTCVYFVWKQ